MMQEDFEKKTSAEKRAALKGTESGRSRTLGHNN